MKWVGKDPPIYIYLGDEWVRESDQKTFKTDEENKSWVAEDGEMIKWPKKSKITRRLT